MPPAIPLLVNLGVALTLLTVGSILVVGRREGLPPMAGFLATLPLLDVAVLVAFVFGEDSYRGNGISRWDAYRSPGGALGYMFAVSVALLSICAALLAYSGLRGHRRFLLRAAFAGGLGALFLVTPTIIGFNNN